MLPLGPKPRSVNNRRKGDTMIRRRVVSSKKTKVRSSRECLRTPYNAYVHCELGKEVWKQEFLKTFEGAELEALFDEDPWQTQQELSSALEVTRQAISKRFHALEMIQKQGNWIPL
ncbi:hypothetical protein Trydic_g12156 [Trypoxylus dichotomus]